MASAETKPSMAPRDFGYSFLNPVGLGYEQAQFALQSPPTNRHFDPDSVSVCHYEMGSDRFATRTYKLGPELPTKTMRVAIGPVSIKDRKKKKLQLYTYGSMLSVVTQGPDRAVLTIQSGAPIIDLTHTDGNPSAEIALFSQAIIASRCADHRQKYPDSMPAFYEDLTLWDPRALYYAHLRAFRDKYRGMQRKGRLLERQQVALRAVEVELKRLLELSPDFTRTPDL